MWGETFCRSCGRPYVKPNSWREDMYNMNTMGKVSKSWCDLTIGSIALWLHRSLRGGGGGMPEL